MSAAGVAVGVLSATAIVLALGGPSSPRHRSRPGAPVRRPTPGGRGGPRGSTRPTGLVVAAVVAVVAVVVLGPVLAAGAATGVVAVRVAVRRAGRRREQRTKDRAFPDLVDLLRIAVAAGHPVVRCVEMVADRAPAPHRPALLGARGRIGRGASVADALVEAGPELGPLGPALVDLLVSGHRTGAPLGPPLDRLAATARHRRARAAEAEARRLPVTMLFPLVGCILPAFVLLAVVPLLVASFGSLQR